MKMPVEEEWTMATIAAGGYGGVFAFLKMAKRLYDRDSETGLTEFIRRALPTMGKADQMEIVATVLTALFSTEHKARH